MKKLIMSLLLLLFVGSEMAGADVNVRGYRRSDGTYVQPHHRSDPNSSRKDNWSTKGNVNPYTGEGGTQDPDADQRREY